MSVGPFDDPDGSYLVLASGGHRSLWPAFAAVPEGWTIVFGPDGRAACLAHVEADATRPTARRCAPS